MPLVPWSQTSQWLMSVVSPGVVSVPLLLCGCRNSELHILPVTGDLSCSTPFAPNVVYTSLACIGVWSLGHFITFPSLYSPLIFPPILPGTSGGYYVHVGPPCSAGQLRWAQEFPSLFLSPSLLAIHFNWNNTQYVEIQKKMTRN